MYGAYHNCIPFNTNLITLEGRVGPLGQFRNFLFQKSTDSAFNVLLDYISDTFGGNLFVLYTLCDCLNAFYCIPCYNDKKILCLMQTYFAKRHQIVYLNS